MLKEIIEKSSALGIHEKRNISGEYCELVIYAKEIDAWTKILTRFLGPAAKPPKKKPSREDLSLAKGYGGIFENQTLFKKVLDDTIIIAMFWPWQDKDHVTLKIALIKK